MQIKPSKAKTSLPFQLPLKKM